MDVQTGRFCQWPVSQNRKRIDSIEHNKEVALLTKILPTQA
jgi:hypothetical protein